MESRVASVRLGCSVRAACRLVRWLDVDATSTSPLCPETRPDRTLTLCDTRVCEGPELDTAHNYRALWTNLKVTNESVRVRSKANGSEATSVKYITEATPVPRAPARDVPLRATHRPGPHRGRTCSARVTNTLTGHCNYACTAWYPLIAESYSPVEVDHVYRTAVTLQLQSSPRAGADLRRGRAFYQIALRCGTCRRAAPA